MEDMRSLGGRQRSAFVVVVTSMALLVPASWASAAPAAASATPGAASVQERTDYGEVIRTLNTEIPAAMQEAGIVGLTIALVDGDRVVLAKGFGDADRAAGRRVTDETLFHIGSTSKTLAAIAVMQLVEEGLVDLDAPMSRYVPEFSMLPRFQGNEITVRQVLDHHSGIPGDVFNGLITIGEPVPEFNAWLVEALQSMYPERRVDTMWGYNNSGYALLQNVVENVSGMGFEAYAQENVFGPMGMTSSYFDDRLAKSRDMTRNYVTEESADGGRTTTAYPREYVNGWPAGSVLSNADDMAKYMQTLLAGGKGENGRILKSSTLRQMWTRQARPPLDVIFTHYGLGFALGDPALDWTGEEVVWHNGATILNFTMMRLLPESGLGAYVSINTAGAPNISQSVADRAISLAFTAKTGTPQPAGTGSASPAASTWPTTSRPATWCTPAPAATCSPATAWSASPRRSTPSTACGTTSPATSPAGSTRSSAITSPDQSREGPLRHLPPAAHPR